MLIIGNAFLCGIDDWMDIWGDPLLPSTISILSYGVVALLIFRVSRDNQALERRYWRLCGYLFLFQLVNTHLDLQALVWATGRCLASCPGLVRESPGEPGPVPDRSWHPDYFDFARSPDCIFPKHTWKHPSDHRGYCRPRRHDC